MPNPEASMAKLSAVKICGGLDRFQGYWQCPLSQEAQKIFTIASPGGVYRPQRVLQGVLKAASYFQATLVRILEGLNSFIWVDDIVYWEVGEDDLVDTLDLILERLEEAGVNVAAHKCMFL